MTKKQTKKSSPKIKKSKFENLELDATPEQLDELVKLFVESRLHPASVSLFNDNLDKMTIHEALFNAVINDEVIVALEEFLKKQKEFK